MKKVHFGCGTNILEGWQNLDLPQTDVRKKLKYGNEEVNYIFHEHLLEHLDQVDGVRFLKECHRILKTGGKMRICCPCVDGFIYIYQNWEKANKKWRASHDNNRNHFLNNAIYGEGAFYKGKRFKSGTVVNINNGEEWHKYLWDKEELTRVLKVLGFEDITSFSKLKSSDHNLTNLERRGKEILLENDLYFSDFPEEVDLVIEATKK